MTFLLASIVAVKQGKNLTDKKTSQRNYYDRFVLRDVFDVPEKQEKAKYG